MVGLVPKVSDGPRHYLFRQGLCKGDLGVLSTWKDRDSYQKAFQRLVKNLQAPAQAASA